MKIKTSCDLKSSLIGSAFRRISFDGHTFDLRRIMTMRGSTTECGQGQSHCDVASVEDFVRTLHDAPVAGPKAESRKRS